jgi:enterochelin esterase-like enzyme
VLERFTIPSSRIPDRQITVYSPDRTDETARTANRPLLVLHDGQNLFDADRSFVAGETWRVQETVDELIATGAIPPVVVAGIDHGADRRAFEYTPTAGRRGGGGAAAYGRFVIEDVVPHVAAEFGARATGIAIGGSSLGALAALVTARQFPGRVERLLLMSPSVWWDRRVVLQRLKRVPLDGRPRVWLDIGHHEGDASIRNARALRDLLRRQSSALQYLEDPAGHHREVDWARRLPAALTWLFS